MSAALLLALGVAVALALGAGIAIGRRQSRPPRVSSPVSRVDAHLTAADMREDASPLRRDVQAQTERTEAREDLALLDNVLRDVRDLSGADEAIFWRWIEARGTLLPSAWSTDAPRPAHFDVSAWASHVRWSAEQGALQLIRDGDAIVLAAAPVASDDRLFGALSLSAVGGLREDLAGGTREWTARFASQLASWIELLELRHEHARYRRQGEALIGAILTLQETASAETLAHSICRTAIDVTSASSAALVRWFAGEDRGVVQACEGAIALPDALSVPPDSLVGRCCAERQPLTLPDARSATAAVSPFGPAAPHHGFGSLAIVPIVRQQQVIGAIVIGGEVPDAVTAHDGRNIALLAAVTRGSLEIAWEIEEVNVRARTDALTGLANRRHFDERLEMIIAETDRFGGSCSLILADIDRFKAVNDELGHEAGDIVLKHVARTLCEGIRTVDVCARYGGEEIALLLPQTSLVGATELAERLRQKLESNAVLVGPGPRSVTASFGVASYPEPVPYGDWLFPAADRAMYEAKEAGRNQVRVITPRDVTTKLYGRRVGG